MDDGITTSHRIDNATGESHRIEVSAVDNRTASRRSELEKADRRAESEKAERRENRIMFTVSGVIAAALAPVAFIFVVWNTMVPSDCIPNWGPCPTTEGVAMGAASAGVLVVIACVLLGLALKNWD